jgi:excisionase family DNA binding protein
MKEKFLTLKEVANLLRVSERSVFRYIHNGRLKATKVGYWRISEKDLGEFIKRNSNARNKK